MPWDLIALVAGILIVVIWATVLIVRNFYRKVDQGHAMIINKTGGHVEVSFTGGLIIPVIHRVEVMDLSVKTIEVDRQGANGLICSDNIRADIKVTFFVRVNAERESVLKVASMVGVGRASDPKTLEDLFQAKFSEALKTVGKKMNFTDLYNERDRFKDEIVRVIGHDLNGYNLEDAAIDYLEQTPLKMLDPDNIFDSEGRKKIIDLTAQQRVKANEIQREAEKTIKKQDVETREAVLALERQQAEAEAKQQREIATTRARENAERQKVEAEELRKATEAQVQTEQEIGVVRQHAQREIEIAAKNREGAVAVENERIQKERMLEAVTRERAVELSQIEKEKIIAVERKNIAEVIRERVAVEKTVAEEEERIKDVRVLSEAERLKKAALTRADQEAEAQRIQEVKLAQGAEQAAAHNAKEKLILAEANQAAAEKDALAAIRRAEAKQAETAAEGLAHARVREADAEATRKQGMAEASVKEATGLAQAKVREADAEAARKQGMAEVAVKEASAAAVEQLGAAEASAIEAKITGEARGLAEKAASMAKLTAETKQHEEFRLRLQSEVEVAKERIQSGVLMAGENARILAEAMKHAKFDIVGGDGEFFDRFVKAVTLGRTIDATVDSSATVKQLAKGYLDGSENLPADIKEVLLNTNLGSGDLANLSLSALLAKLFASKDPTKVQELLSHAKRLGFVDGEVVRKG